MEKYSDHYVHIHVCVCVCVCVCVSNKNKKFYQIFLLKVTKVFTKIPFFLIKQIIIFGPSDFGVK